MITMIALVLVEAVVVEAVVEVLALVLVEALVKMVDVLSSLCQVFEIGGSCTLIFQLCFFQEAYITCRQHQSALLCSALLALKRSRQ